jgi:diguanylate cyclase
MVRELFVNVCILISFLFIGSQVFKNSGVSAKARISTKFLLGIMCGFLGCVLMVYSLFVTETTLLDLRFIAIVVAAISSDIIAPMVSAVIMASFRVIYFGISKASIIGVIIIIITAIACGLVSKTKISAIRKWIYMFLICLVVWSIALAILVPDINYLVKVLIYFWTASIIAGVSVYYLSEYLVVSNQLLRRLKEESAKDFLTGLNNVRRFDSIYNRLLDSAKEKNEKLSILMVDIDHFKKVNDTYGHPAGDAVLKQLGEVMMNSSRSIDVVSRMGGEEFSIILPECSSEQAYSIGERIRNSVQDNSFILPDGKEIKITVSIGSTSYPETVSDIEQLVKEADKALYKAKQTGRNKVCVNNE